jgi:hypothetical protein
MLHEVMLDPQTLSCSLRYAIPSNRVPFRADRLQVIPGT